MSDDRQNQPDETVLIALEQIGQAMRLMESLFQRLEQHVHSQSEDNDDPGTPRLDDQIPPERTIH